MSIEKRLKEENLLSGHDENYFVNEENAFSQGDRYFDHFPFFNRQVPTLHLVDDHLLAGGLRVALDDTAISNMNAIISVFLAEYLCHWNTKFLYSIINYILLVNVITALLSAPHHYHRKWPRM